MYSGYDSIKIKRGPYTAVGPVLRSANITGLFFLLNINMSCVYLLYNIIMYKMGVYNAYEENNNRSAAPFFYYFTPSTCVIHDDEN